MASKKGGKVKKPTLVEKLKAMRQEYKEATKKLRANETDEEREFRYRMSRSPMERFKSGGAVKKKSIDGVAMRGKTKVKRVKG
jgi:hypothetical protein